MRSMRASLLSHYSKKQVVGDHMNEGVGMGKCQREAVINGGKGDIQLFVFTISHPSREVGCVLFPGGFSPRGHEDVYGIRG